MVLAHEQNKTGKLDNPPLGCAFLRVPRLPMGIGGFLLGARSLLRSKSDLKRKGGELDVAMHVKRLGLSVSKFAL